MANNEDIHSSSVTDEHGVKVNGVAGTGMRMEGFKKLGDDLERVIEKDDSGSSITTDSEESKPLEPQNIRARVNTVMHTRWFQFAVIGLVIVDCLLVIAEMLIDFKVVEVGHESPWPHVLHYTSIGILSIFLIEIMVKLWAMRLEFFKHYMEVFDAVVVIVSFALDVAFINNEDVSSAAGLLIVLRLWRIARVVNGMVMQVQAKADRKLNKETRHREAVEQELAKFREYCATQEKEIEMLQALLKKHGIAFDTVEKPVIVSTIDVVAEVNQLTEKMQEIQDSPLPSDATVA